MRWVLALLALAALGLGSWTLLGSSTTAPPPPAGGSAADERDPGAAGVATGSAADLDGGSDLAGGDAPAIERVDGNSDLPELDGPIIRVVRGAAGAPAPDVKVCFVLERSWRERNEQRMSRWDAPELLGQRARTDAEGKVQLPRGRGRDRWVLSAHAPGEFGYAVVAARPDEHTVTLEADEYVDVRVLDHLGAPTAIELSVLQTEDPNDSDPIWVGRSDRDGEARVRHMQRLRKKSDDDVPKDYVERFAVIAEVPTLPPTLTEFAGRPATGQTVTVQLPPLGELSVQLTNHAGSPLLSPASIGFGIPRRVRTDDGFPVDSGPLMQRAQKPKGAAPVALPYAPVGAELTVYARYPHDRRAATAAGQPGPTEAGATAALTLKPLSRHCVIIGRFVLPGGRPVSAERVDVTIWRDDQAQTTARAYPLADGRWDLVLTGAGDAAQQRVEFRCRPETSGDELPERWLGAIVDLKTCPPGEDVDLGDIELAELPPLCAGVVVDDRGAPIANAEVTVQQVRIEEVRTRGARTQQLEILLQNQRGAVRPNVRPQTTTTTRERWRNVPNLRVRTGADGTFVIAGQRPPGRLRVEADTDQHFAATVPLDQPNQDLRIRIDRNGVLRGNVLLPEWLPDRAVTVKLEPTDPAQRRQARSSTVRAGRGGGFVLAPLMPGEHTLTVSVRNLSEPLVTLASFHVRPGDNADPRLQPLDLRSALFRFRLQARDAAGAPMKLDGPIHARLQKLDGTFVDAGFRWQDGRAELITAHRSAELTFFGRGFQPMKQTYGPGDHDVYLQTLRPALVEVPGARSLAGPTRRVRISAILQGDTGYPSSLGGVDQRSGRRFSFPRWDLGRSSGGWLGDSDLVEIPLMTAGKYQIILRAHATESERTPQTSVTLGTFELQPGATSVVTVPVDAVAVTEALRNVDEQHRQREERRNNRNRAPGRPR